MKRVHEIIRLLFVLLSVKAVVRLKRARVSAESAKLKLAARDNIIIVFI